MKRWCKACFVTVVVAIGSGGAGFAVADSGEQGAQECLTGEQKALIGQDEVAARAVLPELSRVIPPNSPVTQDFRPERVNVDLDGDGIVTRVWCG